MAKRLSTTVTADRMEAWVAFADRTAKGPFPTEEEVLGELRGENIAITDLVKKRVKAFAEMLEIPDERTRRFVVAKGQAATEGQDAKFVRRKGLVSKQKQKSGKQRIRAGKYSRQSMAGVDEDTFLGELTPAVPARNGVDVFGAEIQPKQAPTEIELHASVRTEDATPPLRVVSAIAGAFRFESNLLRVHESIDIRGNVDPGTGDVECPVDVTIGGSILDNHTVKSTKSIKVTGVIQAAVVVAKEDIHALGGVLGKEKGRLAAGGTITAKFIEEASAKAKGDICVERAVMNSHMETQSRLIAPNATIRGGTSIAREGAEIGELGSDSAVPTHIIVGGKSNAHLEADPEMLRIRKLYQTLRTEWKTLAALRDSAEGLSPSQKKRRKELRCELELRKREFAAAKEARDQTASMAGPTQTATVQICRLLQPGVIIQIGNRMTTIKRPMRGPLRVEEKKIDDRNQLVAISTTGDQVLPSVTVAKLRPKKKKKEKKEKKRRSPSR